MNDERFLRKIVFSDEATFHVCGHVHRHNVRVWAAENPRVYVEYERNTPKKMSSFNAPPHYDNIVREFLDTTFPQRWIGRGAVMAWPPRSPDLTPLDFYLRGYVKQHVYSERINDINHLKQRITDVIHCVTPDVLTRVWGERDYRLDACRATNGTHIELR
ncbi:hypothetical protein AVEN_271697-1 [Araneus ventricosus]|uniref:Uncharacterized protein n=1 Tax=Araneus ventricosus TaxID=182803 RepID=A0A4Y2VXR3_ARAVE|nr:hypothetical protein AVEN_271697-1 [Araneus ventricosus]